ncbi:hypothetical protein ACHHYP_08991 [Achlya hypogyna]|uniref:Uncharacterized protein n=1 Tax=Achlya hypogyna TaxID=1202772 RepID=A0A1V9ZJN6_ACHHY|nr:hypothetical protein ACHHYP_08991 [Achlya hypogyna]
MLGEDDVSTRELMYDILDAQQHDPMDPTFQKRLYDRQRKREYRKQIPHEMRYLKQRIEELEQQLDVLQAQREVKTEEEANSLTISWQIVATVFEEEAQQALMENQALRKRLDEMNHIMLREDDVSTREIMYDILEAQKHDLTNPDARRRMMARLRKREYRKQVPHELRYLKQRIQELEHELQALRAKHGNGGLELSWREVAIVFEAQADEALRENQALRDQLLEVQELQELLQLIPLEL